MALRNGEHGYGVVTKLLHWLTVAAIVGQFLVGATMEADDDAFRPREGPHRRVGGRRQGSRQRAGR